MKALLKVLSKIASGIGAVLGVWVSVTLLAIGKVTSVVSKLRKPVSQNKAN